MKKIILFILVFTSLYVNGQTNLNTIPSIAKLMSWCSMTPSKFDLDARSFGFSFDTSDKSDLSTDKVYFRKLKIGGFIITERLVYRKMLSDNSTVIHLIITRDLMKHYSIERQKQGFRETDCYITFDDMETGFCFGNKTHTLILKDKKKESDEETYNQYSAIIYKK